MAYLKKDAPAEVVETLRQAEAQADECWRGLQILSTQPGMLGRMKTVRRASFRRRDYLSAEKKATERRGAPSLHG